MVFLILFLLFVFVAGISWLGGLWTNLISIMILTIAGLIATNFFEPLAATLDTSMPTYTYLLDFVAFWFIFFVTLVVFRGFTDILSRYRVKFDQWTELIGRSVACLWVGWLFISIVAFSFQIAPLPPNVVQSTPSSRMMLIGPDRIWIGFVQSRSRGALARGAFSDAARHPDDLDSNIEAFDGQADLIYRYRVRREKLATKSAMRVNRGN